VRHPPWLPDNLELVEAERRYARAIPHPPGAATRQLGISRHKLACLLTP
jgi:hypothetical protein